MIRNKRPNPNPTLILTADWHLREINPVCRTDNFWDAQWKKIGFIRELQEKYGCAILHGGDFFDHWKPSPLLISNAIKTCPKKLSICYGNHDLPQHNLDLAQKCGVNTLQIAGKVEVLPGGHWGQPPHTMMLGERKILIWHIMTWDGKRLPWPGCTDLSAQEILEKYPDYDLILTGHNHKAFVVENNGRLLVNPGSLTRQEADQENHLPSIYLWYSTSNSIVRIYLPIEKCVISREHIERKQERDLRISAFVEKLNMQNGKISGLDFHKSLEEFENSNNIRQSVMDIIWRAIDE